jgi:hypothetical protein
MPTHSHTYAHQPKVKQKLTKDERVYLRHSMHEHMLAVRGIKERDRLLRHARFHKSHVAMHSRRSFQRIYRGHNVHKIHKLPSA